MPKIQTPAPATPEAPQVDIAAIIETILAPLASFKDGFQKAHEAKVEVAALLAIAIEDNELDKAAVRQICISAIAQTYGVKEKAVANSPKDGGNGSLYTLTSELMRVAFPKEEFKEKTRKALENREPWIDVVNIARNGTKKPKKIERAQKDAVPYTLDIFGEDLLKMLIRCRMADFSQAGVDDTIRAIGEQAWALDLATLTQAKE